MFEALELVNNQVDGRLCGDSSLPCDRASSCYQRMLSACEIVSERSITLDRGAAKRQAVEHCPRECPRSFVSFLLLIATEEQKRYQQIQRLIAVDLNRSQRD